MKTLLLLSTIFILNNQASAALTGAYDLVKGPSECPSGVIDIKTDEKSKERTLIFGSRHSWFLNDKSLSQTTEVVEQGCSYTLDYELTETAFKSKTTRAKCPKKSENSVIKESLVMKENTLTYSYSSLPAIGKSSTFNCTYNRSK